MNKSELLAVAKPILFNTPMVQAILDGRKTATRRIVKQNTQAILNSQYHKEHPEVEDKTLIEKLCEPPYKNNDILYVRETWCKTDCFGLQNGYVYRADGAKNDIFQDTGFTPIWRPSIHMPKEAARIFLRVTDVRVERLQECGKDWCIGIEKEGVTTPQSPILYINDDAFHNALREEFQKLWDSTIKKANLDRYGWDANPFVWVIEFERLEE
ncbi:hypothetical protein FMM68_03905 [Lachnospiraceae bacterium MD329]|nr:hypothetical protein [Lachnospiraceae bacterium MD329]